MLIVNCDNKVEIIYLISALDMRVGIILATIASDRVLFDEAVIFLLYLIIIFVFVP